MVLQPAGKHTGQHHAQCHKSGTNSVMCRFVLSIGKINQVKHVSSKTKTVSKLLDRHSSINQQHIFGHIPRQIKISQMGQCNAESHRPNPEFQTFARSSYSTHNTSKCQCDNTYRAIDQSHLSGGKSEPAYFAPIEQERRRQFHEHSFTQAVEQHERNGNADTSFSEKSGKCLSEFNENIFGRMIFWCIGSGFWQHKTVIDKQQQEETCQNVKGNTPG